MVVATVLRGLSADSVPQLPPTLKSPCFFSLSFFLENSDCTRWSLKSSSGCIKWLWAQRPILPNLIPSGPFQHPLWSPLTDIHDRQHICPEVPQHLYKNDGLRLKFLKDSASWVPEVRRKGNVEYQRHPFQRYSMYVPHFFFFFFFVRFIYFWCTGSLLLQAGLFFAVCAGFTGMAFHRSTALGSGELQ